MNVRCDGRGGRIHRAGALRSPAYRGSSKGAAVARWPLDTGRATVRWMFGAMDAADGFTAPVP